MRYPKYKNNNYICNLKYIDKISKIPIIVEIQEI